MEVKALTQSVEKMKNQIAELQKFLTEKEKELPHITPTTIEAQPQEQTTKRTFSWSTPKSVDHDHEQEVTRCL